MPESLPSPSLECGPVGVLGDGLPGDVYRNSYDPATKRPRTPFTDISTQEESDFPNSFVNLYVSQPDQAFHLKNRVFSIDYGLALSRLADQPFTGLIRSHH